MLRSLIIISEWESRKLLIINYGIFLMFYLIFRQVAWESVCDIFLLVTISKLLEVRQEPWRCFVLATFQGHEEETPGERPREPERFPRSATKLRTASKVRSYWPGTCANVCELIRVNMHKDESAYRVFLNARPAKWAALYCLKRFPLLCLQCM